MNKILSHARHKFKCIAFYWNKILIDESHYFFVPKIDWQVQIWSPHLIYLAKSFGKRKCGLDLWTMINGLGKMVVGPIWYVQCFTLANWFKKFYPLFQNVLDILGKEHTTMSIIYFLVTNDWKSIARLGSINHSSCRQNKTPNHLTVLSMIFRWQQIIISNGI